MDYKNKTVLITGASSDIGISIIEFFVKCQANVIVTYCKSKDKAMNLVERLNKDYNVNLECVYVDLCKENSIDMLYNYVKEKYGKVDILINNAALSLDNDIDSKTKKEFMKVLETNVVGTFLMMKYFDKIVDGYIFNMSSTDGIDTGNIYSIDYNASKAAINSLTKTFSLYSENKIISICPNWVDTNSTKQMDKNYLENELKRIGQDKLISVDTISKVIDDCIRNNISSGSIIRIEGDDNYGRID